MTAAPLSLSLSSLSRARSNAGQENPRGKRDDVNHARRSRRRTNRVPRRHVMPRKPNDFARNDDIYEKLETCEEEERRRESTTTSKAKSEEDMEKEATEIRRAMME